MSVDLRHTRARLGWLKRFDPESPEVAELQRLLAYAQIRRRLDTLTEQDARIVIRRLAGPGDGR